MSRELEKSIRKSGAGNSKIYFFSDPTGSDSVRKWTLELILLAAGTAKLQVSAASENDILNGADNVVWFDWAKGDVTVSTQDSPLAPMNAVRINVTSGDWALNILGDL